MRDALHGFVCAGPADASSASIEVLVTFAAQLQCQESKARILTPGFWNKHPGLWNKFSG